MARRSKKTAKLCAEILLRLSGGEPLAKICRDAHTPDPSTWRDWCDADQSLAIAYARARDEGFDAIAAEVMAIADDKTEDPQSRRVRIDARLKLLAKWDPQRYGEKLDITSAGEAFRAPPAAHFWAIPSLPAPEKTQG